MEKIKHTVETWSKKLLNFDWVRYCGRLTLPATAVYSEFFFTKVKWFSEFHFTSKFWVFKFKTLFRMTGDRKISSRHFFAKKMAEWSRQALLHGTQYRFMHRKMRFIFCGIAAKCFIKNAWRWSSSISFCYEAFSVSLQIWSIRFAHMM